MCYNGSLDFREYSSIMLLFYIRHGRPTYAPDELRPAGRRQSEAVARRLALYGVDRVFSSTSNRAIETARPTCDLCELEMTVLDWCNESHAWKETSVDDGDGHAAWAFTVPKWQRLFVSEEVRRLGDSWYDHPAFAGTMFKEGIQRVDREADAFLASLGYVHDRSRHLYAGERPNESRIALFAHEGFGKMFLASVLDIPYCTFCTHFAMSYTGMTVLEFRSVDGIAIPRALTVANDGHLYRDGLPTHYQNRIRF